MKKQFKILLLTLMFSVISLNAQSLRIEPTELIKDISNYRY